MSDHTSPRCASFRSSIREDEMKIVALLRQMERNPDSPKSRGAVTQIRTIKARLAGTRAVQDDHLAEVSA